MGNELKRKTSSKIKSKLLLVLLVASVILLGVKVAGEWRKHSKINDEIARMRSEADRLESRNLEILELSKELTNEEFLEREARLKLGLQRPGETVLVLGRESGAEEVKTDFRDPEASRTRNAKRWWYYFFDHDRFGALKSELQSRRPIKPAI